MRQMKYFPRAGNKNHGENILPKGLWNKDLHKTVNNEGNPAHIAAHWQAPVYAHNQNLQKSYSFTHA